MDGRREVRIVTRELVCPDGADMFRLPGGEWPCGGRYIAPRDAALMLGISRKTLWAHTADGGVPLDPWRWVSLDWVLGIQRARRAAEADL